MAKEIYKGSNKDLKSLERTNANIYKYSALVSQQSIIAAAIISRIQAGISAAGQEITVQGKAAVSRTKIEGKRQKREKVAEQSTSTTNGRKEKPAGGVKESNRKKHDKAENAVALVKKESRRDRKQHPEAK